jgi:hypothetical protein
MRISVRDIFHRGDPIARMPSAETEVDRPHGDAGMACIACGDPLPLVLEQLGSLRCHDCRDGVANPNPTYRPSF